MRAYVGLAHQDRQPRPTRRNRGVSSVALVRPPSDDPANS